MKCTVYSRTLYYGHPGDMVKCPVNSGTPLLWTPFGDLVKCPVYSGTPLLWTPFGDPLKCPVYSGTPLLWTPWGPGEVSCIDRCPHFRGKFILRKHTWNIAKCP